MKIRGHLVDMPLNFLIVRNTMELCEISLIWVGGEIYDGGCKSLSADIGHVLTSAELARCQPIHASFVRLSRRIRYWI